MPMAAARGDTPSTAPRRALASSGLASLAVPRRTAARRLADAEPARPAATYDGAICTYELASLLPQCGSTYNRATHRTLPRQNHSITLHAVPRVPLLCCCSS
ncbi:hypothetical protein GUJ93_ZPchr0013g36749 [Zizania palustris]|uniref:Uncharacterized protein n=1 Tax=Zizania palustris TaxID=103762 RepID=A0A8J5WVX4_ZIZPA|nr:hypothetical protein GUJ93_ZPchr0013g36749 [Zizania palustris]